MNQEWKEKWVAALRSGEYKQGTGRLRTLDNFCCLGVLCDIVAKEEPENYRWDNSESLRSLFLTPTGSYGSSVLPGYLANVLGLIANGREVRDPLIETNMGRKELSYLNDKDRLTFDELADLIEAQL